MGKLTALHVARAKKRGMYGDGLGLYLQVGLGGARSWIYRFSLNGSERYLGLGSANAIPLKRARELAAEARQLRAEGIDSSGGAMTVWLSVSPMPRRRHSLSAARNISRRTRPNGAIPSIDSSGATRSQPM